MRLLIIPFILALLAGCQSQNNEETFTFASSGEFRPFSFTDDQGALQGYDIDVGRELAKRMNKEAKPMKYKFPSIVEGVKNGRFDAAVASHTITDERKEHVAFTIPYYFSGPQIFTRNGEEYHAPEGIKTKDIAVSKGSTYATLAAKFTDKLSVYDSDITALEALNTGRHDLVITDAITGAMAIKRGLKVQGLEKLGESRQGIAVAKENTELLQLLNKELKSMQTDGTLKSIGVKYFGRDISVSTEIIKPGN
ncbi:MAG: amino acid ABC transporter substrate-binding protein [Halobacteriovorax sp.]|nr:amino acid ABC transporter substrate-binding protein [Halobacteriovorax sp.]